MREYAESKSVALRGLNGIGDYELLRVQTAEKFFAPALLEAMGDVSSLTALEIGCGKGLKAAVFGDYFKRYVGVDLEENEVKIAQRNLSRIGSKAECQHANGIEVARFPRQFGFDRRPDVLIMFAVLEHLLPDERVELLRLMRDVVSDGGAILVAETPNRLIANDVHSSQLQFAQFLPPELMLRYVQKSKHEPWIWSLRNWGNSVVALHRAGLGLSYHDFELDFVDDTNNIPFGFTGWSHHLLAHQPLQNDEAALLRYFRDNDIQVHPTFARYWLEGLIFKGARRQHTSVQIIDLQPVLPNNAQAWNFPEVEIIPTRPAVVQIDICADEIDLTIQFNASESRGELQVASHRIDLGASVGSGGHAWRGIGTATVRVVAGELVIRATERATLRGLVANGYQKSFA